MEQCFINVEDIEVHIELPISSGDHLTRSQKTTVISGKGIVLEPIRLKDKKAGGSPCDLNVGKVLTAFLINDGTGKSWYSASGQSSVAHS
jgi:hypothetical protein